MKGVFIMDSYFNKIQNFYIEERNGIFILLVKDREVKDGERWVAVPITEAEAKMIRNYLNDRLERKKEP